MTVPYSEITICNLLDEFKSVCTHVHTHTHIHMLALLNADYCVPGTHISTLYILTQVVIKITLWVTVNIISILRWDTHRIK